MLVPIEGRTYEIRQELKALGGRWDAEAKVWMVPEENAGEARRLLRHVPNDGGYRSPFKWQERE